MDILNIVMFVVCSISLYFTIKILFFKKKINIKTAQTKKEELIQKYTNMMENIMIKYENDKAELTIQKMNTLKQINQELNVNIFFDKTEVRELLLKLSNM